MATTRIKDLSKTATTVNSDANLVLDGNTGGTQKITRDNFRQDTADAFVAAPGTYNLAPLNSGTGKIDATYLPTSSDTPKGAWNASTNTPTLADGSGTAGDYYDVTVAGSSDLGSGSITFTVGDVVKYNGTAWFKIDSVTNILDGVSTIDGAKAAIEIPNVGVSPNEVPLSGQLGTMAFQDSAGVSVARAEVESTTGTATTQALTVTDGSSTNFVVQEDGKTGIGTASPSAPLSVESSSTPKATFGYGGSSAEHQLAWDSSKFNISADAGNAVANSEIGFFVDGSKRALIDSSGRVGINQTSPGSNANAIADDLVVGNTGQSSGVTVVGGTGSTSAMVFGSGGTTIKGGMVYDHSSNQLEFSANSATRWLINSSGNLRANGAYGIDLGSGATLSDYEEGTFTPTIYYQNSSGLTISYTTQTGRYVRVGDLVSVHAYVRWTVTGTPVNDHIGVGSLPHQPNAAKQHLQCVDSQGQSATAECSSSSSVVIALSSSLTGNLADNIGAGTHTMLVSGTYQTS